MSNEHADRVLALTDEIIKSTGPRLIGEKSTKSCARKLEDMAKTFATSVSTESFTAHPGAFLGFIRFMVGAYIVAIPLLFLSPWLSFIVLTLGLIAFVGEHALYKEILDPFFKKVEGINVIGTVEPPDGCDRQVIVSGHHDSAHIFNFFVDKPERYSQRLYSGIGSYFLFWLGTIAAGIANGLLLTGIEAILFFSALLFVVPLWGFASKDAAPGAGDNLASSLTAFEIAKIFSERLKRGELKRTRIIFISFDGEEAGLRGARAFAKTHREELSSKPTFALNMDCVYQKDKFRLLLSDLNGSVQLDVAATDHLVNLGKELGLSITAAPIIFLTGGTDAAELSKVGVRTTSLMGMDWSNTARSSVYHTPKDTVDSIEPAAVEAAIQLGVKFIEDIDSGKLA